MSFLPKEGSYGVIDPSAYSPSEFAFSQNTSRADAAINSARQNTASELYRRFYTPEKYIHTIENGFGTIAMVQPTKPYTDETLLIVSMENSTLSDPNNFEEFNSEAFKAKILKSKLIYDFDSVNQIFYWKTVLATLKAYENKFGVDENLRIFAVENVVPRTSNKYRTSKSISLPHTHIVVIDTNNIEPPFNRSWHQGIEEEFFKAHTEEFNTLTQLLNNRLPEWEKEKLVDGGIKFMATPPLGYEFTFKVGIDELLKDPVHVQQMMAVNHEIFGKLGKRFQALIREEAIRDRLIPPPAYRKYMYLNKDGKLCMRISPVFFSYAGVMEGAHVNLVRDKKFKEKYTKDQLNQLHGELIKDIEIQMNNKKVI